MRRLVLMACLTFLAIWAAYVHTLNPAFRADDSPETATACITLGIQHPPGYPLHTLIGRIFSLLPLGAPCFRLNLMAAFFGALTCVFLGILVSQFSPPLTPLSHRQRDAGGSPAPLMGAGLALWAGALAALLLAFSPTFWSQSLAAKGGIYTLHAALLALLALSLSRWHAQAQGLTARSWATLLNLPAFALSVLIFFVGLGNHWETQALVGPAALAFCFFVLRAHASHAKALPTPFRMRGLLFIALMAIAGLSVYLSLPLRARLHPALNWGDPQTWGQFWWVLLRQEYLDLEVGFLKSVQAALLGKGPWSAVAENWAYVSRQGSRVLSHLGGPNADLSVPAVALSLFGAWAMHKAGQAMHPLLAFMLTLGAGFVFVVTFYFHLKPEMVWILDVFLLPVYFAQAALAAYGVMHLWRWRGAGLALLLLPLGFGFYTWRSPGVTQIEQYLAWDYGQDFLRSLKPRAIVFAEGDFNTMPVYYLQLIAGKRPDVDHLTTVFLSTDWGTEHVKRRQPHLGLRELPKAQTGARAGDGLVLKTAISQIAQAASGERPIHASLFRQVQAENIREWEPHFSPSGLSAQLNVPDNPSEDLRRAGLLKSFSTRHLSLDRDHLEPSPEFALSNYGTAFLEYANYLRARGRHRQALPYYPLACRYTSHSNLAEAYTHWGIALASGGKDGKHPDLNDAAEKFLLALKVKPLYEALANLAGVYNQGNRYLEAEPYARQALGLQPNSGQSWNNLAVSLYGQKRLSDAIAALEEAVKWAPNDPQILGNLKALKASK